MNELTREQILAMPAGIKLDTLVAHHVMGYDEHNFEFDEEIQESHRLEFNECLQEEVWEPFEPSTKISAAWEVESTIKEISGGQGLITNYMTQLFLIVGNKGFDYVHATPEQRCKAALLAVMGL